MGYTEGIADLISCVVAEMLFLEVTLAIVWI